MSGEEVAIVDRLTKRFAPDAPLALDAISFSIKSGQVTGVAGPDGAGKTTLMRLMAGLLTPTEGSLTVCGYDTMKDSIALHHVIGYMPQRFGLYEDLTVLENLTLYADLRGVVGKARSETFERLLAFTDLARFTGRLAGNLSGGMKQKLGLACAMLKSPRLLLLDEPSVGVDPISRRELWRMVNALTHEGVAVVWTTAYLDEAENCAEVIVLNNGALLYKGDPKVMTAEIGDRVFVVEGAGGERRTLLARALSKPEIIDGVLQGDKVRLVVRENAPPPKPEDLGGGSSGIERRAAPAEQASPLPGGEGQGEGKQPSGVADDGGIVRRVRESETPHPSPQPSPSGRGSPVAAAPSSLPATDAATPIGELAYPIALGEGQGEARLSIRIEPAKPRFEDAFVAMLGGQPKRTLDLKAPRQTASEGSAAVEAVNLTKKFGDFTAADRISFSIRRGEIFGLLGPNGAGKSTTFKMMCGLLRPTGGTARVDGFDLYRAPSAARGRLGYMAQKFSLYGDLSVRQNLDFFGGAYGLAGAKKRDAIDRVVAAFDLGPHLGVNAGALPLGFKQRLALSCAILHNPPVLFLDEPTSGVDPITRREFWGYINSMVATGVTVMVTTHFMEEAEYCDRVALIYRGQSIAIDTPDALQARVRTKALPNPTLEDAFIALIEAQDRREVA